MSTRGSGAYAGRWVVAAVVAVSLIGGGISSGGDAPEADLGAVETAFAETMAARDLEAFAGFLDPEAVFFNGPNELRGRQAVVDAWSPYFTEAGAPFSWRPEVVSILDSGELGLTSGPVFDPDGNRIGIFNSIWRRNPEGEWKIVFDRGCRE